MANSIVQRGLRQINQTHTRRTGEGEDTPESKKAKKGRKARKRRKTESADAELEGMQGAMGYAGIDGFEEIDPEKENKKKEAMEVCGDDEEELMPEKDGTHNRDVENLVAPEFQAQFRAGIASANSRTAGSTTKSEAALKD